MRPPAPDLLNVCGHLHPVTLLGRGGDRLLVAVQFLQKGASIQLEDFQVEPIGP